MTVGRRQNVNLLQSKADVTRCVALTQTNFIHYAIKITHRVRSLCQSMAFVLKSRNAGYYIDATQRDASWVITIRVIPERCIISTQGKAFQTKCDHYYVEIFILIYLLKITYIALTQRNTSCVNNIKRLLPNGALCPLSFIQYAIITAHRGT